MGDTKVSQEAGIKPGPRNNFMDYPLVVDAFLLGFFSGLTLALVLILAVNR